MPGEAAAPVREMAAAGGPGYKDAETSATLRADGSVMLGDMARFTATALGEFGFLDRAGSSMGRRSVAAAATADEGGTPAAAAMVAARARDV